MPTSVRPSWDEYFVHVAVAVSARADCTRRQVGAIVVSPERRIVGTGYNGGPSGGKSCLAGECPRGLKSYEEVAARSDYESAAGSCIAIHAEVNALLHSDVAMRKGGTLYVTCAPCDGCWKFVQNSGVARLVFAKEDGTLVEYPMPFSTGRR